MGQEMVVLLDGGGHAVGEAPKRGVHHRATPLHLAFSCYIVNPDGLLLVTQRALSKHVFPGVWTNAVCGHPAPGERLDDAVRRRAESELGLVIDRVRLILPTFAYRAEMDGVVEYELCPVFVATMALDACPVPDPAEVEQLRWLTWADLVEQVRGPDWSIWSAQQVELLEPLGDDPRTWPTGDRRLLPPAASMGP